MASGQISIWIIMIERMKPHQSEPRLDDTRRDQEIRVCEA